MGQSAAFFVFGTLLGAIMVNKIHPLSSLSAAANRKMAACALGGPEGQGDVENPTPPPAEQPHSGADDIVAAAAFPDRALPHRKPSFVSHPVTVFLTLLGAFGIMTILVGTNVATSRRVYVSADNPSVHQFLFGVAAIFLVFIAFFVLALRRVFPKERHLRVCLTLNLFTVPPCT